MFRNASRMAAGAAAALAVAAAILPATSMAQAYPNKPVRVVLPFPAGGTTDLFARILSQKLQESTGQSWIIDYKPGGATMIATNSVRTAAPDGYTVLVGLNVMPTNLLMYKKVDYKMEDFAPISLFAMGPLAMAVSKSVAANSLAELVAFIKANPGKINYATLGTGGSPHLVAKMMEQHYGLQMQDIPYKGSAPAMQALMAGDVQIYFDSAATSVAQQRAGTIKIFGVTAEDRMKGAPELPTLKEQGLPITSASWFGYFVPAATPKPIINFIHREVVKAVATSDYQSRVIGAAQIPISSASPEEFHAFIERNTEGWAKVIKPLNLQLEL